MDTQAASALLPGWRATCAVGIVAATLLSSCERESDPHEVHTQANAPIAHRRAPDLYVDIAEGAVTVRAHDAPLQAVIEKLAEHGGLQVWVQDRLDERVTVELHSLTLAAALQELLRGRSFILVGARQTTDARQESRGTLWIISKGSNGANASAASGENAREFARREGLKSLEELSAALTDHDSNARLDAVSELGHFDDEQAAMMLASVVSRDEHPSVRAEALHAIGSSRADTHGPVFTRALTDLDAGVRKAAISALESIGAESSVQTLAIALKDHDASVRATAVDAIGEIGGDAARRLLESALADESAVVREAATEQLGQPSSLEHGSKVARRSAPRPSLRRAGSR